MYNKREVHSFICREDYPLVETDKGMIRGYMLNEMFHFLGIPYAKARRFEMPEECDPWDAVLDTQDYGFLCPQLPDREVKGNLAFPKRYWLEREDCQTLNIWTESLDPGEKMPVVVWLHGGGFSKGSCLELEAYDGENIGRYGHVVSVSINHRLNILGFLDLSDYGNQYACSGNVGMEDIVAALRWIQKNISRFGGDPENVTIFGESGGGGKVSTLLQMGDADGLYHKAIIESGVLASLGRSPREEKEEKKAFAKAVVEAIGGIDQLTRASYQEMMDAVARVSNHNPFVNWGPVPLCGSYIGDAWSVGFRKEANDIPVICGSVFQELVPRNDDFREKELLSDDERYQAVVNAYGTEAAPLIRKAFEKAYPEFNLYYASLADCMVRRPTKKYCMLRRESGAKATYNFMFAHETMYKGGLLSTHADELSFVFHNVEYNPSQFAEGRELLLQDQIFHAWMQFARTGNPNHPGIPEWKPLLPNENNCFVFSKAPSCRVDHDDELMELLRKYSKHAVPFFLRKKEDE